MATQNGTNPNTTSKLKIEAVQTVTPTKTTEPWQIRQVEVSPDPVGQSAMFQRSLNMVLYYDKVNEKDSGWVVAGWIKETLGRALVEQPMVSGRLRRHEDGSGNMEIVSNDSGVRLIEARVQATLSEYLGRKKSRSGGEDVDGDELVFWKDIDEQSPQYSPLFYVQVTNFDCGGYSIGISCSLLLADLLIAENFLKSWADIHKRIISENDVADAPKTPIFYLPNLKRASCSPANPNITPNQTHNSDQTMIFDFDFNDQSLNLSGDEPDVKKHVFAAVQAVETRFGAKTTSEVIPLFIKEYSSSTIKIETFTKSQVTNNNYVEVISRSWDDFGLNDIAFSKGDNNSSNPTRVKYGLGSAVVGVAMVILSSEKGTVSGGSMKVIVSIPAREKGI